MKRVLLAIFIGIILLVSWTFAAVTITATVGNVKPVVGQIQLCDGTCALTKTVDPATQLTIKVAVTDPNGQSDINVNSFHLEFFKSSDSNGVTVSWDHNIIAVADHGTRDGCTETGSTYCLQIDTADWTTKFLAGTAKVFVRVKDNTGGEDSNTTGASLTVNPTIGHTEDSTSATYSGTPGSTANTILTNQANAYVVSTHNGNIDMNITVQATDLNSATAGMDKANQKWHTSDVYASSTSFTGAADKVKLYWSRGTYPDSNTQNIYLWLDIPASQPIGDYNGTLTFSTTTG